MRDATAADLAWTIGTVFQTPDEQISEAAVEDEIAPLLAGGEHVVLQQKFELEMLEQRRRLGRRDIQEIVDRSYVLQGLGFAGHNSHALRPRM